MAAKNRIAGIPSVIKLTSLRRSLRKKLFPRDPLTPVVQLIMPPFEIDKNSLSVLVGVLFLTNFLSLFASFPTLFVLAKINSIFFYHDPLYSLFLFITNKLLISHYMYKTEIPELMYANLLLTMDIGGFIN